MIFISSIHSLIFFHHFCITHSWGKMWSAYALTGIRPTLAAVPNHQWRVAQGRWGEAGGWRRWVRESSWDARLEHGAPSGTAPQYSPKCSQLCSHPSLTQNTELPGWQSLVCVPSSPSRMLDMVCHSEQCRVWLRQACHLAKILGSRS